MIKSIVFHENSAVWQLTFLAAGLELGTYYEQ